LARRRFKSSRTMVYDLLKELYLNVAARYIV
jgi:hypothetical protein